MYRMLGAIGAVQDPKGQSWNTDKYQACMGLAVQSCGVQAQSGKWSDEQLQTCIELAQQRCIAEAESAKMKMWTYAAIGAGALVGLLVLIKR